MSSTILRRWAEHAEEAADARRIDRLEVALGTIADRHRDHPAGDATTLFVALNALGETAS